MKKVLNKIKLFIELKKKINKEKNIAKQSN